MTVVAEKETGAEATGTRAGHPLRAEAVRGFAPWGGLAVLLTLTVMLAMESERWQGDWAETRDQLNVAAGLLGIPLALAAGCWHGGRERRRGTEELLATSVRGPLARLLASALPLMLWIVAGYVAAAVLALLATWYCATGDSPYLLTPLADAVALASAALAGQVVGRLVAWRLTAPLLGVGGYVVLGILSYDSQGALRHLSPVLDATQNAVVVWWQPVVMAVWTGGLGIAVLVGYAARRRAVALLPLAAAAAAGALLVQAGDGMWHTNPLSRRQVCDTTTTPQICVNARYEGMLPEVKKALSGLTDRLEGVQNLPVRFEDLPHEPGRDEAQLPMLTTGWAVVRGRLADPERYAWEAGMALSGRRIECQEVTPSLDRIDTAVQHYLAPSPAEKVFDELAAKGDKEDRADLAARLDARARLEAMGDQERRTWLSAYFTTAQECDPSEVPSL